MTRITRIQRSRAIVSPPVNIRYFRGMWGLGDNIFQRPFIRELARDGPLWLDTPWPELYDDISNVNFVLGNRSLRTQLKNIKRQNLARWSTAPPGNPRLIGYNMRRGTIISDLAESFGMSQFKAELDLPPQKPLPYKINQPIAIIRPTTVRTEWFNYARNPLPEYIFQLAERLMETHYVIAIADLCADEVLVGDMPPSHSAFVHGELDINHLLALVANSDIIIGGVGWIVPAAVAAHVRAFVVLGGQGGHNAPGKIMAPWWHHKVGFAYPDKFCNCIQMRHQCAKSVSNLSTQFESYLSQTS